MYLSWGDFATEIRLHTNASVSLNKSDNMKGKIIIFFIRFNNKSQKNDMG